MTVRYGIIGTGMMGCEHIRNLAAIDGVDVIAIADPSERSLQWGVDACAGKFSPRTHENYNAVLEADDIDAVVIASPNFTHIDVMRQAFKTDKHVMLEKPMCTTLTDALEVHRSAQDHEGLVWVALEYRYMAPIAGLLDHLPSVGDVKMCAIREHRFPFLNKVNHWNRFNRNTGGTLVEKCCHFFDLMNLVIKSKPERVIASGAQSVNHLDESYEGETPDILDNAYVIVEYENQARAMLDLCMFAEGSKHEQQLAVTGDTGKLETTVPGNELYLSKRQGMTLETIPVPMDSAVKETGFHHGASYLEHLAFLAAIRENRAATVTTEDGLMSILIGMAGQESIRTGQPVDIQDFINQQAN